MPHRDSDVDRLVEKIEKLEARIVELEVDNKILEGALDFYAKGNHKPGLKLGMGRVSVLETGEVAAQALERLK